MKRFIINILVVLLATAGFLSLLSWYDANSLQRINLKVSEDKHIAVFGPSTTARAINEDIISDIFNMSRNAVWLTDVLPILPNFLDANPQIDTVWINHGRFLFVHMGQAKDKASLHLLREKMPLFFYDKSQTNWNELLTDENFYAAFLTPDLYNIAMNKKTTLEDFGFKHVIKPERNFIDCPEKSGIAIYDSLMKMHGGKEYSKEWIMEHCGDADKSVRKAIDVCKQRNVVPVLLFTPLYNYSNWYSWDGFCNYMKENYDENLLIADYEDFDIPDIGYRTDIIHLNMWGSDYFSEHLVKNGLNAIPLKDWLKTKGH